MSKTFKDKSDKYQDLAKLDKRKPKEGKRFESSKGRKNKPLKHQLEDYFI